MISKKNLVCIQICSVLGVILGIGNLLWHIREGYWRGWHLHPIYLTPVLLFITGVVFSVSLIVASLFVLKLKNWARLLVCYLFALNLLCEVLIIIVPDRIPVASFPKLKLYRIWPKK